MTALDILNKYRATDTNFKFRSMTDNHLVLAAMREMYKLGYSDSANPILMETLEERLKQLFPEK